MTLNPYNFDHKKFIDRDFEQSLFEELLQLSDSARLLAIRDAGGMGKSELLRKFQYRCRMLRPRLPVALIQQPDDLTSPAAWVKRLEQELSDPFNLHFPQFRALDLARANHDFTAIDGLRGQVDARGANFNQAQQVRAAGVLVEQATHVTLQVSPLTAEQSRNIEKALVQAFLSDLHALCQTQPIVLLIDHYEKIPRPLQDWLVTVFLEGYCFDMQRRPPQLILVLAGRELPFFDSHWPEEECQRIIKSVHSLSKWGKQHVEECLRVYGYAYQPHEVETFFNWIQTGTPPADIVSIIKMRLLQQGKAI